MPSRRTILRATTLGALLGTAGCLGDDAGDDGSGTPTDAPTDTATPDEPTATAMALPEGCPPPEFDRVPAFPENRDAEAIETFVREFERAYQRHSLPENQRLHDVEISDVREVRGGYEVELDGEAEQVMPEDGTATSLPVDGLVWEATYRIADSTVERTLYGIPSGGKLESQCWTVDSSGDGSDSLAMPEECTSAPDVDGLPSLPDERTDSSITSFVTAYERTYKAHTAPDDRRVDDVAVTEVEPVGDGYRARAQVDMAPAQAADGEGTPTAMPTDTGLFVVTYRIDGQRVHREETHFTGGTTGEECWRLESADGSD